MHIFYYLIFLLIFLLNHICSFIAEPDYLTVEPDDVFTTDLVTVVVAVAVAYIFNIKILSIFSRLLILSQHSLISLMFH
jgi:hypothetical protein